MYDASVKRTIWNFTRLLLLKFQFSFISVSYIASQDRTDISRWSGITSRRSLEVSDHLVEVFVDLGELGGQLLVLEGVALLVEDLGHGGDQQQSLLGVGLGEVDGLAGGQLQGGARGLLASQVPERFLLEVSFRFESLTWQRRGGAPGGLRWPQC